MNKHLCIVLLCLLAASPLWAEMRVWTNVKGETIKADVVGVVDDFVFFQSLTGKRFKYPVAGLIPADREYLNGWRERRIASGRSVARTTAAQRIPLSSSKIARMVSPHLVKPVGESLRKAPLSMSSTPKYYAFYYSAHWCPPCKAFTPSLVKFYDTMKARGADFEIIFVSADRSEQDMAKYMREFDMNWRAVAYDVGRSDPAMKQFAGAGIPCLVFMDHTGKVLSDSYVNGNYVGPQRVLKDMRQVLQEDLKERG